MTDLPFHGDQLEKPVTHPLLGHRVTVTLARKGSHTTACPTPFDTPCSCLTLTADETLVGKLIRLDAGGGFGIQLDDGRMLYRWPALDITANPT